MRYDKRIGLVLFAALLAVSLANEFSITPFAISDSDFTTYIIVPLLMLPLLALFIMKERMVPEVGVRDVLVGIGAFALLFLLTVLLRLRLSYIFVGMHVDMLLFPLLIVSLALLLFGIRNISKFKAIALYSILASPAILLWLGSANSGFVIANTLVIYNIVKLVFPHVGYLAPLTITANGYSVGIGETCVGIGILIGIVLFLAPIAYLYDGKFSKKVLWIASGFCLMLILNVLRMLGIVVAWFFYGPSNAILTIHLFAGVLLFYIAIIVMILVSRSYGLSFPTYKKDERTRQTQGRCYILGICIAVAVTVVYYLMLSDYPTLPVIPPLSLYNSVSFNSGNLAGLIDTIENQSAFNVTAIQSNIQNDIVFRFTNSTFNSTAPIALLVQSPSLNDLPALLKNNTVVGERIFFSNASLLQQVYYLNSYGHGFMLYVEKKPYVYPNGTSTSADIYSVFPANMTPSGIVCGNYYNMFYTEMANIPDLASYNRTAEAKIVSAYCIVEKLVNK